MKVEDYLQEKGIDVKFGWAGKLNQYVCDTCGHVTTTVDRVNGVTPYLIGCRGLDPCKGQGGNAGRDLARSRCYKNIPEDAQPTYEWYRPEYMDDLGDMDQWSQEHVLQGGLLLRPIVRGRNGSLKIVVFKDDPIVGPWAAVCLDHYVAAQGNSHVAAIEELKSMMRAEVFLGAIKGNYVAPLEGISPAPKKYWDMWEEANDKEYI